MSDTKAGKLADGELAAYTTRVLAIMAAADTREDLFWRCDGEHWPVTFWVDCSDVFSFAMADLEPIAPSTVDALEKAIEDVREKAEGDATFGPALYACRRRGSRPQPAAYPSDKRLWPLFDACGPELSAPTAAGVDTAPVKQGGYRLNAEPNEWGCHDPQCLDSTWDHECPVVPT